MLSSLVIIGKYDNGFLPCSICIDHDRFNMISLMIRIIVGLLGLPYMSRVTLDDAACPTLLKAFKSRTDGWPDEASSSISINSVFYCPRHSLSHLAIRTSANNTLNASQQTQLPKVKALVSEGAE